MLSRRYSRFTVPIAVAVFAAVVIGVILLRDSGGGAPPANDDKYDDSWGKAASRAGFAEFTHVLIGWEGLEGTVIKQPGRTKEEALELVVDIWRRYRADRTEANWRALQVQYNDDSADPHFVYRTSGGPPLAPTMVRCAETTHIGYARICETPYGFHLIRRER